MSFKTLSVSLELDVSRYSANLSTAGQVTLRFGDQVRAAGQQAGAVFDQAGVQVGRYATQLREASSDVVSSSNRMGSALGDVVKIAGGFGLGTAAVQLFRSGIGFAKDAVFDFNSQLQTATLGFTTMLGSADKARQLLTDLQHFAVTTPFEFPDLVTASQRMLAMGFSAKEIIPDLTAIGDAVAGLGGGKDLIDRVTIALGQLLTRGKVTADNMRQLTEAGIPAWQILADKMHLSTSAVQDLSQKGLLPARQAIDELTAGMEERFGGLMDRVSHTWQGALSNIKDISTQALAGIFRPFFNAIASDADRLATGLTSSGFQAWIKSVEQSEQQVIPELLAQVKRLDPAFRGVASAAGDVGNVIGHLASDLGPLASAIGQLAGGAAVGGLNTFATVLSTTTGFLADHREIVLGVAGVYAATLIPQLLTAADAFGTIVAMNIAQTFRNGVAAVRDFAAGVSEAGAATSLLETGITGALGIGLAVAVTHLNDGTKAVDAFKKSVSQGVDTTSLAGLDQALASANAKARDLNSSIRAADKFRLEVPGMKDPVTKALESADTAKQAITELQAQRNNLAANLADIQTRTGLTANQITTRAAQMGISLTDSFKSSASARKGVIDDLTKMAASAGLTTQQFGQLGGNSIQMSQQVSDALTKAAQQTGISSAQILAEFGNDEDAIKAFGDTTSKAMDATASAWQKDADVISTVSGQIAQDEKDRTAQAEQAAKDRASAAKTHQTALDGLHKAQQNLAELDQRQAAQKTHTVSDAQERAHAVQSIADAQGKVNEAVDTGNQQKAIPSATQRLVDFYKTAVGQARAFTTQINDATTRGLDPNLIARLLEAGPQQAAPLLQTILSDHSGNLIKIANEGEKALADLNVRAVENQRLLQRAIQATTDQVPKDLQNAMKAAQLEAASGGKLTADALATALGLRIEDVKRIMAEYGIIVAQGIDAAAALAGMTQQWDAIKGSLSTEPGKTPTVGVSVRAAGGLDSHIVTHETILYGERETGGEAFVPRLGDPGRAFDTLATAASWYGFGIVPMAAGGVLPQPPDYSAYGMVGRPPGTVDSNLYKAAVSFLASTTVGFGGGPAPIGGPPPQGSVTDWLTAALKLTGSPSSWLPGLYQIAEHESGGNPLARNLWDVNARAGNPSEGLMQTTLSTFRSFAVPGHGNIFDPIDNAAAAIGYIQRRYGDPYSTPGLRDLARTGHYSNYRHGGIAMATGGLAPARPVDHSRPSVMVSLDSGTAAEVRALRAEMAAMAGALAAPRGPIIGQQVFNEKVDPLHVAAAVDWELPY